jgi:hypothetical protein
LFEFFRELLGNPEATDSLGGLKQSGKIDDWQHVLKLWILIGQSLLGNVSS